MEAGGFERDYWLSGTPDILDPGEEELKRTLNPDMIRLEGLDLVDTEQPELGWKMSLTDGVPIPEEPEDL